MGAASQLQVKCGQVSVWGVREGGERGRVDAGVFVCVCERGENV